MGQSQLGRSAGSNACLLGSARACIETASRATHVWAHGHRRSRFAERRLSSSRVLPWLYDCYLGSPRVIARDGLSGISRLPSWQLAPSSASSVRMRWGSAPMATGATDSCRDAPSLPSCHARSAARSSDNPPVVRATFSTCAGRRGTWGTSIPSGWPYAFIGPHTSSPPSVFT